MALLGHAIKGAIQLADTLQPTKHPVEAQHVVLKTLLETAMHTEFGKHYDFETILKAEHIEEAFAERVPFFDYHRLKKEWWHKIYNGQQDVTWPGYPDYFALSSGTTGQTSKRIPVTGDMLKAIRSSGIKQILSLNNFGLSADLFEKDILMLGSSTDLNAKLNDTLEGEISGISASNIPSWFRPYYKPGIEIAKIDDWDLRVKRIAQHAQSWDVGALSGIPSWIELMLEEVIAHHKLKNIHEIWPNLQVYTSGGVAFGPYEKSFNALMGKPVQVIDTYLASEGYIATQVRPETDAMQLNFDQGIYFEFVPFQQDYINEDGTLKADVPVYTLAQVELETDYVLVISTVSGAWRYMIGDTVQFTDIERAEIKITGRTKFFLNTVGSQLSVNKMDEAMRYLEQEFDTEIKEYTISAVRDDNGEFYHHWYLGCDMGIAPETIANHLDEFLKNANKNYKVARTKALKGINVSLTPVDNFYEWNNQNKKKGGQVKMERVMSEDKFRDWENFIISTKKP